MHFLGHMGGGRKHEAVVLFWRKFGATLRHFDALMRRYAIKNRVIAHIRAFMRLRAGTHAISSQKGHQERA